MIVHGRQNQQGTTMLFTLVFLVGMFLAVGWATDSGHLWVNNTRLQNAVDAAALSAAIAVNSDVNHDTGAANLKGKATFDLFKAAPGNGELAGLAADDLTFEYSRTFWSSDGSGPLFVPGTAPATFVRVTTNPPVPHVVIQSLPAINVDVRATAGPVGQNCSLTPFVLCATMNGGAPDENCDDDSNGDGNLDCFGYEIGEINDLVIACNGSGNGGCPDDSLESGNYNLLDLDGLQGGKDIRDALADPFGRNICVNGNTLNTKPGYTWGNVKQGIDNRFDSDTQTHEYTAPSYDPSAYTDYKDNLSGHGEGNGRREMAAPIGDCRGLQNGNSDLPKVGVACLFLTEKAVQAGSEKKIMTEFTGASCLQSGAFSPVNPTLNGPYQIILLKTEQSNDS